MGTRIEGNRNLNRGEWESEPRGTGAGTNGNWFIESEPSGTGVNICCFSAERTFCCFQPFLLFFSRKGRRSRSLRPRAGSRCIRPGYASNLALSLSFSMFHPRLSDSHSTDRDAASGSPLRFSPHVYPSVSRSICFYFLRVPPTSDLGDAAASGSSRKPPPPAFF